MRRSLMRVLALLVVILLTSRARADDATLFDRPHLAPTVHVGTSVAHARAGLGVDFSIHRWLFLDAWASRLSRPYADDYDKYPGAWTAGLAANSRVAWHRQAFVYGAGLVYTSVFHCPARCTLVASGLDEHRAAPDMVAVQLRAGYELYLWRAWFLRALFTFDLPFVTGQVRHIEPGSPEYSYDYDEGPLRFMHASWVLTTGYAFDL